MANFQEALRDGLRSALCTYLQIGRNMYWAYSRGIPAANIGYGVTSAAHRFFCNREPPAEATPTPAFTGGQCAGKSYFVRVIGTVDIPGLGVQNVDLRNDSFQIYGAITGAGLRATPSGGWEAYVDGRNASGVATTFSLGGGCCWSPAPTCTTTSIQVTTRFGEPDDCGDPEPDPVPPPDNSTTNITVNYTDNSGNNVNVPVYLVFAPFILNANAELTIPIRIAFNNTFSPSFNAEANFSTGDINFNFGNPNTSGSNNSCEPTPDNYDTPDDDPVIPPDVPTGDPIPDRDDPQDETRGVIRAVIATVTQMPVNATEIFQDENPNIILPRAGNVQFLIQTGNRLSWTSDQPIRNRRNFIPCPWEGGAIDVKATPAEGYLVELTRIYANSQYPVALLQ